jgi:FtsH-binding integral membrane protein
MSSPHPESFNSYARRCGIIFAAVVCGTLLMVATSLAPIPNRSLATALVLAGACVNAFLVAGYLMHLLSEKRAIYALLVFTGIFFVGLMGLTVWAAHDVPSILHH